MEEQIYKKLMSISPEEEKIIAATEKNSKARIKAESRLDAFYEVLEITDKKED